MTCRWGQLAALGTVLATHAASAQSNDVPSAMPVQLGATALPDSRALLLDVERNEKRFEALRRDYTYHVHLEQQELDKSGGVKKQEITDSESLTIEGVRVDRTVARNGRALTPEEQTKESNRIDKEVTKARDRRAKALGKGEDTDDRGDTVLSAARILELGRFTHQRRVELNGRPTIVLDYTGDPGAKTHSQSEEIVRDLVGTVWIDEADHVLVRAEGHFLNDFKIGGGLLADVRKNTNFHFQTTRVDDGVWLPAKVDGQGSIRLLLFAGFNGRMELVTSDYRRFRVSATILPGTTRVNGNGGPAPEQDRRPNPPPAGSTPQP